MYDAILVTLDGTPTDRVIVEHVKQLAELAQSHLVLLHVADGWAARTYGPDAVSPEISQDTAYLERVRSEFQSMGIPAEAELAYGEPANEIIKWIHQRGCDLVAIAYMDTISLPTYFSAPQLTESSTVSACPFFLLGRNEAFDGKAMIQHLSVCPIVHEKRAAHISGNPDHIHRCTGDQTILNEIANSH